MIELMIAGVPDSVGLDGPTELIMSLAGPRPGPG